MWQKLTKGTVRGISNVSFASELNCRVVIDPHNGKSKEKEPTRQSTLFGLPLGKPLEKPEKRGRKKTITEVSNQLQTQEEGSTPTRPVTESVPESSIQASDVTKADPEAPSEATLVETQQLDELYETQIESQDIPNDMNGVCILKIWMLLAYQSASRKR